MTKLYILNLYFFVDIKREYLKVDEQLYIELKQIRSKILNYSFSYFNVTKIQKQEHKKTYLCFSVQFKRYVQSN